LPVGTDYNTMTSLFNQGRVGMIISGPWALGDAAAAGIDFGFTRIPTIDGGQPAPFVGVQGFMVSAFSENKILAEVFLKEFVVNTDTYLAMFARDPRPPAYKPALEQLEDNLIVQGVRESGGAGVPMPSIPEMGSVWTAWSDAIELVMNQELESQEALDIAVQEVLALLRPSGERGGGAAGAGLGLGPSPGAAGAGPGLSAGPGAAGAGPGLSPSPGAAGAGRGLSRSPSAARAGPGLSPSPGAAGAGLGLSPSPGAAGAGPGLSPSPGLSRSPSAAGAGPGLSRS